MKSNSTAIGCWRLTAKERCRYGRAMITILQHYAQIASALHRLPDETVIDGEVVALDEEGRPSFNLLQNSSSSEARLAYFVFDVLILNGM